MVQRCRADVIAAFPGSAGVPPALSLSLLGPRAGGTPALPGPKTRREKKSHAAVKPLHSVIGLLGRAAMQRVVAQLRRDAAGVIELAVDPRHDLHASGAQIALLLVSLERAGDVVGRFRDLVGEAHSVLARHAGALGEVLQHGVRGVAEQCDAPLGPVLDGLT